MECKWISCDRRGTSTRRPPTHGRHAVTPSRRPGRRGAGGPPHALCLIHFAIAAARHFTCVSVLHTAALDTCFNTYYLLTMYVDVPSKHLQLKKV